MPLPSDEQAFIQAILEQHKRNLRAIKLQAAGYGSLSVPLHLINTIADEEATIARYEQQLQEANHTGQPTVPPLQRSKEPESGDANGDAAAGSHLPRVFISYSHDSEDHKTSVLAVANQLLSEGIDVRLDRYVEHDPPQPWPQWMEAQIEQADWVLIVCTETYLRRVQQREEAGKGHGVLWEANIIYNCLYTDQQYRKFIPVFIGIQNRTWIPRPLQGTSYYVLSKEGDYISLYRRLTNQPENTPSRPGPRRQL